MTGDQWVLAGGLGLALAIIIHFVFPRIPFTAGAFDRLPRSDKEAAIREWGTQRSAISGRLLLHAAVDSSPQIRQTAAFELRRRCDLEDGMIALLKRQEGYSAGLMIALADCGSKKAIPVFMTYLANLAKPGPASVAAEALGKVGAKEAIPLLQAAVGGGDLLCAGRAAVSLSSLGETEVSREWARKLLALPEPKFDPYATPHWVILQQAVLVLEKNGAESDIATLKEFGKGRARRAEEVSRAIAAIEGRVSP